MLRAVVFAFLFVSIADAQEQDKKLLDRLLKPDTTLQNGAQGRQFTAGGATITKTAPTKSFHVATRKAERGFWNTRQISSAEFRTQSSRDGERAASLATRTQIAKADVPYSTTSYAGVRAAPDADRAAPVSDYPDTRPFLGRGKSQKALSAQNHPLTIDEVRELLNKNK